MLWKQSLMMISLTAFALTGCDKEDAKAPETDPGAAKSTATAPAPDKPAPKAPKWEITVEGQRKLSGDMIMKSKVAKFDKYSLIGADQAMVSFDVESLDAAEPYLAMVGFSDTKFMCAKPLSNGPIDMVKLSRSGDKVLVSGVIQCRAEDGTKTKPKISGWFLQR